MRVPTFVIDIALVVSPYLLGFLETQITGQSLIFDALNQLSFAEKFIISILAFLLVEVIDYKFSYNAFVEKTGDDIDRVTVALQHVRTRLDGVQNKLELINHGQTIDKLVTDVKHPYFTNLISKRIKSALIDNNDLFKQTEYTTPCHANTFGAQGIRSTADNLKCVSFIPEYWEDKNDTSYMDTQVNLMKRGVTIKRLFIVNEQNRENTMKQMALQNNLGINTRFIEQSMVEQDFKEKDYLIQDDGLLVELYFDDDSQDRRHRESKELITTDELLVIERKEQFLTNWASARSLENATA